MMFKVNCNEPSPGYIFATENTIADEEARLTRLGLSHYREISYGFRLGERVKIIKDTESHWTVRGFVDDKALIQSSGGNTLLIKVKYLVKL